MLLRDTGRFGALAHSACAETITRRFAQRLYGWFNDEINTPSALRCTAKPQRCAC